MHDLRLIFGRRDLMVRTAPDQALTCDLPAIIRQTLDERIKDTRVIAGAFSS